MLVEPSQLLLFLGATLALTLTPGPAVLFVVARSMDHGRRFGLLSVLGIGLGNAVHTGATALGLAALLASTPLAFTAVKVLGALYLIYLGVRRLREHDGGLRDDLGRSGGPDGGLAPRHVVRQAFTVAVLNPKTALFYLAFLPQFADPARGALPAQLLLLGAIFVLVAVITDSGYALVADRLAGFLRHHPSFVRGERWVSGAIYLGLGALAAVAGSPSPSGG
jgi:threonine/homoserine/homoserine lactone efflux protein